MAQRKEKYARSMDIRVTKLETAVFDDLLPYKMACEQRKARELKAAQKSREDSERLAKEIARHDRDMLTRFAAILIAVVLATAMICTVIPMAA